MSMVMDCFLKSPRFRYRYTGHMAATVDQSDGKVIRQIKMINRLWDGLDIKLTTSVWASLNGCSPDTALRDIQDLMKKNILKRENAGGRSTYYSLVGKTD